ncbi:hypothetical protein Lbys_0203 [Leadbetterella byssophila DSM 17132]|uniref:DUF4440 domain-containing protein n=1 Tax=Leadbetterella byssophila (strain DSM 17132 / JCM 16389 / KACC 11308 / NBRC 106382 / 4M15) TaxID=649349 RepID=E4RU16_LEAB4|nr:hypothetical protein [Leadbetterella byssophila]ADQ15997.1 hypothetical protein Lbys_0203 [Leadbetterella byssophila DSM 17132]
MKRIMITGILSLTTFLFATGQTKMIPSLNNQKKEKMDTTILKNTIVKKAIDALQAADRQTWFSMFTIEAELYDDGNKMDFKTFFDIGHERFTSIDKVENNGLNVYGKFHSDKWGDFKTYFRFHINDKDKIERLDVGQADY